MLIKLHDIHATVINTSCINRIEASDKINNGLVQIKFIMNLQDDIIALYNCKRALEQDLTGQLCIFLI